jgi:hypothetical protein
MILIDASARQGTRIPQILMLPPLNLIATGIRLPFADHASLDHHPPPRPQADFRSPDKHRMWLWQLIDVEGGGTTITSGQAETEAEALALVHRFNQIERIIISLLPSSADEGEYSIQIN